MECDYHDREWGVPLRDERGLFEFLTLEGAQAGLSWKTILAKRDGYRRAFLDYDVPALAALEDDALQARLSDAGIVRNRLKVWSVRSNARAALEAGYGDGGFADLLWSFVDGAPIDGARAGIGDVPAKTDVSDRMSRTLAKRGFRFVGSTICYAFMQAIGMVNDHVAACFRYAEISGARRAR